MSKQQIDENLPSIEGVEKFKEIVEQKARIKAGDNPLYSLEHYDYHSFSVHKGRVFVTFSERQGSDIRTVTLTKEDIYG